MMRRTHTDTIFKVFVCVCKRDLKNKPDGYGMNVLESLTRKHRIDNRFVDIIGSDWLTYDSRLFLSI